MKSEHMKKFMSIVEEIMEIENIYSTDTLNMVDSENHARFIINMVYDHFNGEYPKGYIQEVINIIKLADDI